jgi:hypothetical protein
MMIHNKDMNVYKLLNLEQFPSIGDRARILNWLPGFLVANLP